ncbi:hypothetical protein HBB16_20965 [Pseudonocardia sp. MCCB 268]|nr:hypothetical protein [Pseudonocardia cytotoxica]
MSVAGPVVRRAGARRRAGQRRRRRRWIAGRRRSSLTLVASRLASAAVDARCGAIRLHPEVLAGLGLRSWGRGHPHWSLVTVALAVAGDAGTLHGQARLDDRDLSNAGLTDGACGRRAGGGVPGPRAWLLAPGPRRRRSRSRRCGFGADGQGCPGPRGGCGVAAVAGHAPPPGADASTGGALWPPPSAGRGRPSC